MLKRCLSLFIITVLCSPSVFAAGDVNAKVTAVRADKSGKGYVVFEQDLNGTPATCINGYPNLLAFDVNTPGGQAIMSIALAAQASGQRVRARGTGDCGIYSTIESWSWGYVTK